MSTILLSQIHHPTCLSGDVIHITSITDFLMNSYDADTLIIDLPILYHDPNVSVFEVLFMIFTIYRCKHIKLDIVGGIRSYYPVSMIKEARSAGLDNFVDIDTNSSECNPTCTIRSNMDGLNARQRQILQLICHRGLSNKQIGIVLKISESSVKANIGIILKNFGLRTRTQLAVHVRKYSTNVEIA